MYDAKYTQAETHKSVAGVAFLTVYLSYYSKLQVWMFMLDFQNTMPQIVFLTRRCVHAVFLQNTVH